LYYSKAAFGLDFFGSAAKISGVHFNRPDKPYSPVNSDALAPAEAGALFLAPRLFQYRNPLLVRARQPAAMALF
jgi:hypothetical protein